MDDGSNEKNPKGTKTFVIKEKPKFNDYKNCLLNNEITLKSRQWSKSEAHKVYTEEINKNALSSDNGKRLQTFDRITSYPYVISAGKLWKTELVERKKWFILMIISMKIKENIIQSDQIFQIIHTEY